MKISALICMLVGCAFMAVAAYFYIQELSYLQRAERLTGTVTDLEASTSFQDQQYWTDYCPVVEFRTKEGRDVKYTSDACSEPPDYKVGQKVVMYYDPGDPNATQMQDKYGGMYAGVFIPAIIGIVFALVGLGLFLGSLRRGRAAPVTAASRRRGAATAASASVDPELEMLKELEEAERLKKANAAQPRRKGS